LGRAHAVGDRRQELGASLVGILVVLVTLGALAALAASALTGEQGVTGPADPATTTPGTSTGDVTARRPAGSVGAASAAACKADAATLETAMNSAHAIDGAYPASVSDLVARGFLSEVPGRPGVAFAPEMVGGQATGRILVNGLPAAEGCR